MNTPNTETPKVDPVSPPPPPPPSLVNEPPKADPPAPDAPKPGDAPELNPDGTPKVPEKKADAPATFEADKITLPEGFTKDDAAFGKFTEIMADDKLSPTERGQKLISLQAEFLTKAAEENRTAWNALQDEWKGQVKADKEIGGDKLAPTLQTISKAIDTLGPDSAKAFREAVDFTGVGNHPAFVKGMAAFAKAITEGGHVTGTPPKQKQSLQEEFFPNSPEMK